MDILKLNNNFEKRNYKESKKIFDENNIISKNVKNKTKTKCCPFCGSENFHNHNNYKISLKNSVFYNKIEYLNINYHRYKCKKCHKTFLENIENRYKNTKITKNLTKQIIEDFKTHQIMSYCAEKFKISNVLVKEIIKEFLRKENSKNVENDVKTLSIDEKNLFGKREFYTFFRDYDTEKILYIEKGTKSDIIKNFAEFLGEKSKKIEFVSIDKSLSFISGVENHLPNSKIVLDHFHIIFNLISKYIRNSKKNVRNRLKGQVKKYMNLKKTNPENKDFSLKISEYNKKIKFFDENNYLICKNKYKLNEKEKENLEILLNLDNELKEIYEIRSKITDLMMSNDYNFVKNSYIEMFEKFENSPHRSVKMFCKNNMKYVEYLANHAIFNISNASMESLNRNIKMIYNRGRGYRDKEFFFNLIKYFTVPKRCKIG